MRKLHDRYGPIVRLSPNEVSFIEASAWDDIYGHSLRNPHFPKDPIWHAPAPNGIRSILSANDADHARFRRLLVPGFSEKALREQEPLIQSYMELFITRLLQKTTETDNGMASVNIVQWFSFIAFDIIGHLSFGESFQCLETSQYHPWIAILYSHFKASALMAACRFFPFLERLMRYALPKSVKQQRIDHFNMTKAKVQQRIAAQQNHAWGNADFMTHVLRHNDEKGMSLPEIESTFNILVLAGSETSATALSGTMNYLLNNSAVMELLVREIRTSFANSSEITADRVGKLAYLNAVIEEGLRLCQPVPLGLPRKVPPGGAAVCGHWLQGDVSSALAFFLLGFSYAFLVTRILPLALLYFHFRLLPAFLFYLSLFHPLGVLPLQSFPYLSLRLSSLPSPLLALRALRCTLLCTSSLSTPYLKMNSHVPFN